MKVGAVYVGGRGLEADGAGGGVCVDRVYGRGHSSKLVELCLSKMLNKSLMLKVTYLSVWFPPGSFNFAPGQEWTHPAGRSWSYSATVWLV